MLDGRQQAPQHRMPDQCEIGGALGTDPGRRQDQIDDGDHDPRAKQYCGEQDNHNQHLGSHLPQEVADAPLQLRQLDRLDQHPIARHIGQPATREVRDVTREKQDALSQTRPLL